MKIKKKRNKMKWNKRNSNEILNEKKYEIGNTILKIKWIGVGRREKGGGNSERMKEIKRATGGYVLLTCH